MRGLTKVGGLGILILVVLRMSIGWQLLYEGLWKLDTLSTPKPWSASGYLRNAKGPLRDTFRHLGGPFHLVPGPATDPDDLDWLDPDWVARRWDNWHKRFLAHYGGSLTNRQKANLNILINGRKTYTASLDALPEGLEISTNPGSTFSYSREKKRLNVNGKNHLTPRDTARFMALAAPIANPKTDHDKQQNELRANFRKALDIVNQRQSRLSFKERMRASLLGDPDRAGVDNKKQKGTVDEHWMGEIDKYRLRLNAYEKNLRSADQEFRYEHLNKLASEIQQLRSNLVGPIKALDRELYDRSRRLLTPEQLALGPVPAAASRLRSLSLTTIWSLLIIGGLLIAGLFTRSAAVAGALLLTSFYLVVPPWPGVEQPPGPEHNLFVNKNAIEALALLALACLPTGRWFGLDGMAAVLARKIKTLRKRPKQE